MAASRVVSIVDFSSASAEYVLLHADLPGRLAEPVGVLLKDSKRNELYIRLRRDWDEFAEEDDAEVLSALEDDLNFKAREMGAAGVFDWLEADASNVLRVGEREAVKSLDFEKTLNRLYRENIPVRVKQFLTHLPVYTLSVAAGPFLTNPDDIHADEWMEIPEDLRLDERMFIARIQGHSMEPRIPNGALCVFRRGVVGSRKDRLVLVRNTELADDNQYTVKRYKSEKRETEEGFQHTRIRLESLNPAYPSWDLDEDEEKYEIVAEFVRVLDDEGSTD